MPLDNVLDPQVVEVLKTPLGGLLGGGSVAGAGAVALRFILKNLRDRQERIEMSQAKDAEEHRKFVTHTDLSKCQELHGERARRIEQKIDTEAERAKLADKTLLEEVRSLRPR